MITCGIGKASLLFVSPCRHEHLRQRHQALADGFAEAGHSVYYVNPVQSSGFFLRRRDTGPRLSIIDLHLPFRATGQPGLQRIACRLGRQLLHRHGLWQPRDGVIWIADPSLGYWADARWQAIFYDRCDFHGHFPGQRHSAWQRYESHLYQRCNVIFCSSKALVQTIMPPYQNRVVLVPNACSRCVSPAPRPSGPPWQVISAGAHFEWIDYSWLEMLARHPALRLQIAGPGRGEEFHRLIAHPQVTWHGTLDHQALSEVMQRCHVGVIPFRDLALTRAVDPIKAYEYASFGLRVWVSPVPELDTHPFITDRIDGPAELEPAVSRLATPLPWRTVPTWDDRVRDILGHLALGSMGASA